MDVELDQKKQSAPMLNVNSSRSNLVFCGGGVKGVAYIGVRAALEACGFSFETLERVGGTSAGALAALAFALGFDSERIKEMLLGLDFTKLLDDQNSTVSSNFLLSTIESTHRFFKLAGETDIALMSLPELKKQFGLYPGEYARTWIESMIFKETNIAYCTFKQLQELRATHPHYKDLYVVGYNVNTQLASTFNAETTPDVIISDAVRVSMSIPLIYAPHAPYVLIDGKRVRQSSDLWVDGGLMENYPITLFDKAEYAPHDVALQPDAPFMNTETLGFYFVNDAAEQAFMEGNSKLVPDHSIKNFAAYMGALCTALYNHEKNLDVRSDEYLRTVYLNCNEIQAFEFNVTLSQKQTLAQNAWHSVCKAYGKDLPVPDLLEFKEPVPAPEEAQNQWCVIS
jgi:NTE family protein